MNGSNDNAIELTGRNETESEEKKENGSTVPKKSQSLGEIIVKFFKFFSVEPFLLFYVLPVAISALAVQNLNIEKACLVDLNYTEEICQRVLDGSDDNITDEVRSAALTKVADMSAWQQPLQSSIPAILILFVGAWSDKTGDRKTLMLIPIIGEIVSSAGLLLTTYFFLEWPLWATALIEALPTALSGGYSIAVMGAFSFLADITTEDSRTFRFGVVAVIVTLGLPLGTSISGILTEKLGYYGVFSITLGCYILGLIHTIFKIHNLRNDKIEGTFKEKFIEFFHPKHVLNTISMLFIYPKMQSVKIVLVICAHAVIMGPVIGESAFTYSYTLKKYGMTVVDFSLFSTYSILMGTAGTAIAVTLFSKYLKMNDSFIGIIATACKTVSSFVYGLAPTKAWFFSGPVFDFFGNSAVTAIRSIGTKVVGPDNVGKMCSLIGLVEALLPVIYTPIYSSVFTMTLDTVPGAFYMVGGAMTIPAFFIFVALFIFSKKEKKDVVRNPDKKEMHAYDNALTSL